MALDGTNNHEVAKNNEATTSSSAQAHQENPPAPRRKRRRWGDAAPTTASSNGMPASTAASTVTTPGAAVAATTVLDPKAKLKAMQDSIKARLEAAKKAQAAKARMIPPPAATTANVEPPRPTKRAKHYELDLSVTGPTYSKTTASSESGSKVPSTSHSNKRDHVDTTSKPTKPKNPYLAYSSKTSDGNDATKIDPSNEDEEDVLDERLVNRQQRSRKHRELKFVEPGKWQEIAQRRREKAQKIQDSGFLSGRKTSHSIQANTLGADETTQDTTNIYGPSATETETPEEEDIPLPPRWDAHPDTTMPLFLEWWDMELLPSRLRKQVAQAETRTLNQHSKAALVQNLKQTEASSAMDIDKNDDDDTMSDQKPAAVDLNPEKKDGDNDHSVLRANCWEQVALFHCKTADLVQHIVPVQSPAKTEAPLPVLPLTKKDLKRQRKLRRQEKQRELQDLQAAGLVPAPEPRLTLQNFIRVLGDQAFLDPSKYEQKVVAQIQARQAAHEQRNQERKLTKEQRTAKVTAKLQAKVDKATQSGQIHVALFYVKNMSHPYHRTKVDLNAQQWLITGGVLECPIASCVIVEGSPQAIQKYIRLMTVRMNWVSGPDGATSLEEMDDEVQDDGSTAVSHKFDPTNRCELVWQGMVVKRHFSHFSFQSTETPEQCRKILRQKGLAHYWDQVMNVANSGNQNKSVALKLAPSGNPTQSQDPSSGS